MDTLDPRRRRQPMAGAGSDPASQGVEPPSETALSQVHQGHEGRDGNHTRGDVTPVAAKAGPATSSSPNTMELGLVASPFHSTRIQEEVHLRRSRPATLDQDGIALNMARREAGEGELDPHYESGGFTSASQGEDREAATVGGVRVARVQAEEPDYGSGLPKASPTPHELWPFAVHHASNHNWAQMSELLGMPLVHLLPFGLKVQARRRLQHADKSSWHGRNSFSGPNR